MPLLEKPTDKFYPFFVAPDYRGQGIGKQLLDRMETELKNRGCSEIFLKYLDNPHQPILEKILKQQNWSAPEAKALICNVTTRVNLEELGNSHLVKYIDKLSSKLSDDYTIFPWHTLTEPEIESIKKPTSDWGFG